MVLLIYEEESKLVYIYIGIFGFLGALARFAVSRLTSFYWHSTFPLGTLIVNIAGCFAMGLILTYSLERLTLSPELRLGLTTGLIGAFTTFSTFSLETINLLSAGQITSAIMYVIVSTIGGLMAVRLGTSLARIPFLLLFRADQTESENR